MLENKKIAIVYDWIDKWGGVERVLLTLGEMFPKATFYTSYFDKNKAFWAKNLKINTSFIQNLPKFIKGSRVISLPLYPIAFESFNFNQYDVVISVTSSFAKAVITKPNTRHICYLLTPTRYIWLYSEQYMITPINRFIGVPYIKYLKKWDLVASQRPDKIISISKTVKVRCQKYYKRDSEVIYPPFDTEYWNEIKLRISNDKLPINFIPIKSGSNFKFFLVVSRLEPYKKIDLIVQSFNQLGMDLVIVGEGSLKYKLKTMASKNISFLSGLSDEELGFLYSKAEALIMPQEEDFGYVSLEAQFFGCPVIAYKKGGATETVIEGKTGIFFNKQNKESLLQALERYRVISYNLRTSMGKFAIKNIERFDKVRFIKQFKTSL